MVVVGIIKLVLRVQQVLLERIVIPSQSHGPNPGAHVWNKLGPYQSMVIPHINIVEYKRS